MGQTRRVGARCGGGGGGGKDVFHVANKESENMPLGCASLSCGKSSWQSDVATLKRERRPTWRSRALPSILHPAAAFSVSGAASHSSGWECYKSPLMREEMVWQAEVKLHREQGS